MAIDTTIPIKNVTYNGVEIPIAVVDNGITNKYAKFISQSSGYIPVYEKQSVISTLIMSGLFTSSATKGVE